jgi:hypothetical protein
MFNNKLLSVISVLALGFTACTQPPLFRLSGKLTAPAGSDVKGTIIMACNIEICNPQTQAKANVMTVDATGLSARWSIELSGPGKYQLIAMNAPQGLTGAYKNPKDNSSIVEVDGYNSGGNVDITLVKGTPPAQALDLFKTELPSP